MMPVSYFEVLKALGAEAVLAVAALAVLTLDLAWLRRAEMPVRRQKVGMAAVVGLLLSMIPLCQQFSYPRTVLLGGTLAVDDLILLFKIVIVVLALLTVENGVMLAAVALTTYGMPLVVDLGIFFDVMVAVMVLGILVYRIRENFASMDTSKLNQLKG